jgi:putative hydrolase of the HAD superfamily
VVSVAPSAVEAVIFDWGGTLTPWHTVDLSEQWQVYAREYAEEPAQAQALAARILALEDAAWAQIRAGGQSARIVELLEQAGVDTDNPGHEAALSAYEEFWEPHTFTDPAVAPLFAGLRDRGVRVGLWAAEP